MSLRNYSLPSYPFEPYAYLLNAFTNQELDSIIEMGLQSGLHDAYIAGDKTIDYGVRTCRTAWLGDLNKLPWLFEKLWQLTMSLNQQFYGFDVGCMEQLQFTHYHHSRQEHYGQHVDVAFGSEASILSSRKLSLSLQLSDPDHYTGGDLCLTGGRKNLMMAPRARGTLIVFPSFAMHEVTPVTSGERFSLVTWAHGPKFR